MIIKIKKLRYNDEEKIALLISAVLAFNLTTLLVNTIVNCFLPNTPIDTIICTLIFALIMAYCLPAVIKKLQLTDVLILLIVLLVSIVNMLLFPENEKLISAAMPRFFIAVFPLFFLGRVIENTKIVVDMLTGFSKYIAVIGFLHYLVLILTKQEIGSDNMSFAYYYLPACIMCSYSFIKESDIRNLFFVVLSFATLMLTGTRGPLACLLISIFLFVFYFQEKGKKKYIQTVALVLGIGIVFSPLFDQLIILTDHLLEVIGIQNRIVEKILSGELADSSGRDELYHTVIAGILKKPLTGYGLFGDRLLTTGFNYADKGTYVHNFFLEILCQFGVVVGGIILICFGWRFIMVFSDRSRYLDRKVLLILFLAIGFIKLFFTGSYLYEGMFYLFIGYLYRHRYERKEKANDKKDY